MKTHKMADVTNILLLRAFRLKYGFTQTELAALLYTERSCIAMAEAISRPLSATAEKMFMELREKFNTGVTSPLSANELAVAFDALKYDALITNMNYEKLQLENRLKHLRGEMEMMQATKEAWQLVPEQDNLTNLQQAVFNAARERCEQKLRDCSVGLQLELQLQIKICSAGIQAISDFIAENSL